MLCPLPREPPHWEVLRSQGRAAAWPVGPGLGHRGLLSLHLRLSVALAPLELGKSHP